jgi:hypothetical protein
MFIIANCYIGFCTPTHMKMDPKKKKVRKSKEIEERVGTPVPEKRT